MSNKVAYVAANNEKDARKVGALFLKGDRLGLHWNGAVASHPDDIGQLGRKTFKNVYRVVAELGHRGMVRYLVDRPDKPPYAKGDQVHALTNGGTGRGTTVANGSVTSCEMRTDRPGYWSIAVDFGFKTGEFTVTGKGKDANGYLKRGAMKRD